MLRKRGCPPMSQSWREGAVSAAGFPPALPGLLGRRFPGPQAPPAPVCPGILGRRRPGYFMFTKRVPWLLPWPARTLMVTFPLVILRMLKPTVGIMSSLNCPDWKGESELGKGPKWQVPMGGPLWPRPGSGEPLLPPPHPSSPSRPGGGPWRVPNPPRHPCLQAKRGPDQAQHPPCSRALLRQRGLRKWLSLHGDSPS